MEINTGIDEQARKEIADQLSRLLADTYTLYLKTMAITGTSPGPCSDRFT